MLEHKNKVSIWLGFSEVHENDTEVDVLKDLCGIKDYDLDQQESNFWDNKSTPVEEVLDGLSYSESFKEEFILRCKELDINNAKWITLQYEYHYVSKKRLPEEIEFVGSFNYEKENLSDFMKEIIKRSEKYK